MTDTFTSADLDRAKQDLKPEKFLAPLDFCPQKPLAKQWAFLVAPQREVFFGGAAGGSKSSALLMGALRFINVPGFNAILFRRTFPQLNMQDGLITRLINWTGPARAKGLADWNASEHRMTCRESGATVQFGFMDSEQDAEKYLGTQVQYIAFDELTGFTEYHYTYMFTRNRSDNCPACDAIRSAEYSQQLQKLAATGQYSLDYVTQAILRDGNLPRFIADQEIKKERLSPTLTRLSRDALSQITPRSLRKNLPAPRGTFHRLVAHVPLQMRAASNPGNRGHEWVKARFIDDGQGGDPCKNGSKDCPECGALYKRSEWQSFPSQECPKDGAVLRQGSFFIPAFLYDNTHVNREEYAASLKRSDPLRGEQMLTGNWDIIARGDLFDTDKIIRISFDELPADLQYARGWDFAWTAVETEEARKKNPDWTVGVLMGMAREGTVYVIDVRRERHEPAGVKRMLIATASDDPKAVCQLIQQDPSAGVYVADDMKNSLVGFYFEVEVVSGDKYKRALPFAAAVNAGKVRMVKAAWNADFINELRVAGPSDKFYDHDDQWDAGSWSFIWLTKNRREYAYQAAPAEGISPKRKDPRFEDEPPRSGLRGRFGPGGW